MAWEKVLDGSLPSGFRKPSGFLKSHLEVFISKRVIWSSQGTHSDMINAMMSNGVFSAKFSWNTVSLSGMK